MPKNNEDVKLSKNDLQDIIDLIENAWQQQLQEDEFDIDSIQLVY